MTSRLGGFRRRTAGFVQEARRRTRTRAPALSRAGIRGADRVREQWYRRRPLTPDDPVPRIVDALAAGHPDAVFVQIGAHDGTQLDPLRQTILQSRWTGVMVEPLPFVYERLDERYGAHPRLRLENVAIAPQEGFLPFYFVAPSHDRLWRWYDALGSFRREVVASHDWAIPDIDDRIVTIDVPTITFETLCERHQLTDIDLIQIDTEGFDYEILKLLDLERRRPAVVIYEHLHLTPDDRQAAVALFERLDYEIHADRMDVVAVRADVATEEAVETALAAARAGLSPST